jgi:hypothetical protein
MKYYTESVSDCVEFLSEDCRELHSSVGHQWVFSMRGRNEKCMQDFCTKTSSDLGVRWKILQQACKNPRCLVI